MMGTMTRTAVCAALGLAAAACTHTVPGLVPGNKDHYNVRPTVETLVNHIACELKAANNDVGGKLFDEKYVISVTLLLQVDDQFGATPNATYTEGLKPPDTSLVTQLGLGLDGQRRRTFTTTYYIDAQDLVRSNTPSCTGFDPNKERIYSLNGNLRLSEIVQAGLGARGQQGGIITNPRKPDDKAAAAFGSQVQFIVTQSMSSFGPTWTLRYFKGPSGANGLFNGKMLHTNSATLSFAPTRVVERPSEKTLALDESVKRAQKRLDDARAERTRAQAQLASPTFRTLTPDLKSRQQFSALLADDQVRARERERDEAQVALDESRGQDQARAQEGARDAGIATSRDLLTTMLLQNLPGSR